MEKIGEITIKINPFWLGILTGLIFYSGYAYKEYRYDCYRTVFVGESK